ncbi:MAG: alpha/beta hydrolase-fold protein [Ignavibacteriaceae bacterium]
MKNFLQLIISLLIIFISCYPITFGQGTVETHSFNSPTLGVTKYFKIYLPPGYYQSTENYPVVYFYRNHENEWFNVSSLNQIADGLVDAGLIGDMILVGPNTGSNNGSYAGCVNMLRPDLAPSYGIGTGLFEDYIVNDLINHIDTTFRTISDKNHRGIDGFSLGGFISTVISLHHPDLFSSVGSYDGTIMYEDLDDPGIPGPGPDDGLWMVEPLIDPIFDVPRNVPYMLEHSVINILESADTSTLNQFKANRYHISQSYRDGAGNYLRNKNFVEKLKEKGIRNSWGNPLIHQNAMHTYPMANVHATASLIKHWQTFNGTKISTPTLIDFSITENTGKTLEVVVFNYGSGNLTVYDVQLNSSEFSILDLPTLPITLQPDTDTLVFNIKLSPPSYQSFTDTVYIYSDDPFTPTAKVILKGKGGSFKAEPGNLYATSFTTLYSINTDSLIVTNIGNYGNGTNYMKELSVDPITYELYGLGNVGGTFYDLDLINARGGDGFWFQYFDCTTPTVSAASFGIDSLLYTGSSNGNIYTLDFRYPYWSPPANQIAGTGLTISAMAFNPVDGVLWAAAGTNEIYTIDLISGNTALIGTTGLNKTIDDIAFDYEGALYGLVGTGSQMDTLVTINTSTGFATKLGSLNTTNLNAIAISPEGPVGVIALHNIRPQKYYLSQNFPNPSNPSTKIKYSIPQISQIQIKVYDVLGNEIKTLVNEEKPSGTSCIY